MLGLAIERAHLVNAEAAASQFLRALRGSRSQKAFAKRLGYKGNPITDWEHGRRYPTAREALRAALMVNVDVDRALSAFHSAMPPSRGRLGHELGPWMESVRGGTPISTLAARMGRSRHALSRWLSGRAQLRIHEFFAFVQAATGRLPDLVAAMVPVETVPALSAQFDAMQAARRLAHDAPWTEAVLRVLESPQYAALQKHNDGWIAEQLGITVAEESECLALLNTAGIVRRRSGRFRVRRELAVDTRGDDARVSALLHHWIGVADLRVEKRRDSDWFAYNVFAASTADYQKVRELLRKTFREIRALIASSNDAERTILLNIQLIDLIQNAPPRGT